MCKKLISVVYNQPARAGYHPQLVAVYHQGASVVYHHAKWRDDIRRTLCVNDMPLLSQWIKNKCRM